MTLSNNICKKDITKYLPILLCVFICFNSATSQERNQVSVYAKGQFSKLDFDYTQGKSDMDNGYGFGINYAYYINENWSLVTGAEFQTFSSNIFLADTAGSSEAVDSEGENFEFRYAVSRYSEDQKTDFINIPIKLRYETTGEVSYYVAGGVKVGFDMNSSYNFKALNISTSGYYPQYDAELLGPRFMGFGEFDRLEGESDLELGLNYILNLETGVKLETGQNQHLYLGLFLDYGLSDLKKENETKNFLSYRADEPMNFDIRSTLYAGTGNTSFVEEVKTIAFGLKLSYGLEF